MPKPTVLVVDDDPDVRDLVSLGLRMLYRVETAPDGAAGWRRFEEIRPTVVVSDLGMPGMTGLELLEKIRAHAELRGTPVVLMTGATRGEELPDGFWKMATDADDFIQKPFEVARMLALVQKHIERLAGYRPLGPGSGSYD